MRIVVTGSGGGGHLIPLEPIIDTLRVVFDEEWRDLPAFIDRSRLEVFYMGEIDDNVKTLFKRLDVKTINIPSGKLRRYRSGHTIIDLLIRLPIGIILSLIKMWQIMPDVVISKGGYGSVPVVLAAVFYRVPFIQHESDVASGLASRLMASWASVITVGFSETRKSLLYYQEKTIVTGTPTREALIDIDRTAAKDKLGIAQDIPVLLVMGGSQGASQLNEVLLQVLPSIINDMAVIHLTGKDHFIEVWRSARELLEKSKAQDNYKAFGYLTDDLGQALAAADVVVTRAGATALAELARLRKAAIVIPLDSAAADHQRLNAATFELAGSARVIDPSNLGRALFEQNIRNLIGSSELRDVLSNNIAQFDKPKAARDIVLLAFKLAVGLVPRHPKRLRGKSQKTGKK